MMHILGLNTLYFTQGTNLDGVDEIVIDDSETAFFKNPYTSERKTMAEVLMTKNGTNGTQVLIRTPEVQSYIYQFYQCEGKVSQDEVGALLKNIERGERTIISSYFDGEAGYANDLMAIHENYNKLYHSHEEMNEVPEPKISELSLRLLRDTGFYEFVDIR